MMPSQAVQAQAQGADYCFAYADDGNSLARIDGIRTTPTVTQVGGSGATDIEAMVLSVDNRTVYAANGGTFGMLDLNTGAITAIGSFGTADGIDGTVLLDDVDGLAIDPTTDIFYGVQRRPGAEDILFRFDPSTGAVIPGAFCTDDYAVIPVIAGLIDIDGIGIDADGQLYAVANEEGGGDHLVLIDKTNGTVTDAQGIWWAIDDAKL